LQTNTPHKFHVINQNGMIKAFHIYKNLENQFQIFVYEKSDFFGFAQIAQVEN